MESMTQIYTILYSLLARVGCGRWAVGDGGREKNVRVTSEVRILVHVTQYTQSQIANRKSQTLSTLVHDMYHSH